MWHINLLHTQLTQGWEHEVYWPWCDKPYTSMWHTNLLHRQLTHGWEHEVYCPWCDKPNTSMWHINLLHRQLTQGWEHEVYWPWCDKPNTSMWHINLLHRQLTQGWEHEVYWPWCDKPYTSMWHTNLLHRQLTHGWEHEVYCPWCDKPNTSMWHTNLRHRQLTHGWEHEVYTAHNVTNSTHQCDTSISSTDMAGNMRCVTPYIPGHVLADVYHINVTHQSPQQDSKNFQFTVLAEDWRHIKNKSMAWCKTAVSSVHQQWRYCSLALSHQNAVWDEMSTLSIARPLKPCMVKQ